MSRQNIYDDERFFGLYQRMRRAQTGLNEALEHASTVATAVSNPTAATIARAPVPTEIADHPKVPLFLRRDKCQPRLPSLRSRSPVSRR
jgi:hypothetical protein